MRGEEGQLLFDFYREKKADWSFLPFVENAQSDNDRLLNLQRAFLLTGSKESWRDLWLLSVKVATRCLRGEIKKKRLYTYRADIDMLALDAASLVLLRYKKRYKTGRAWYVKKNYISAIKSACIQTLYHRTKAQKCEQLAIAYMKEGVEKKHAFLIAKNTIEKERKK